jgi:hypothetical protein
VEPEAGGQLNRASAQVHSRTEISSKDLSVARAVDRRYVLIAH